MGGRRLTAVLNTKRHRGLITPPLLVSLSLSPSLQIHAFSGLRPSPQLPSKQLTNLDHLSGWQACALLVHDPQATYWFRERHGALRVERHVKGQFPFQVTFLSTALSNGTLWVLIFEPVQDYRPS